MTATSCISIFSSEIGDFPLNPFSQVVASIATSFAPSSANFGSPCFKAATDFGTSATKIALYLPAHEFKASF
ncbi:hypothetical protein MtrunA17_Chr4g0068721 [Medicago truncatula]|uniref:Uncharacterized protein n=1 Tax=Medicago truncatula TaxID=3880 RepID=I3T7J9_MEDTR|nr:unknown [Medicago truncatula]RHN64399.1 hypothetical protein MtrunA17_Chr4g0068721 [Medicago truncatula]